MKTVIFCFKALIHFIYVLFTPFIKHKYNLTFVKENGNWYIDLPNWPFSHDNLLMVCGADTLCEKLSEGNSSVTVNVITANKELNNDYIRCDRSWAYLQYGGQYYLPVFNNIDVKDMWLCQVTLFVLGWWPKYIYIKKI